MIVEGQHQNNGIVKASPLKLVVALQFCAQTFARNILTLVHVVWYLLTLKVT